MIGLSIFGCQVRVGFGIFGCKIREQSEAQCQWGPPEDSEPAEKKRARGY